MTPWELGRHAAWEPAHSSPGGPGCIVCLALGLASVDSFALERFGNFAWAFSLEPGCNAVLASESTLACRNRCM